MTSSDKLTHILSTLNIDSIRTYVHILGQKGLTSTEIQSKLDSTQKFLEWAYYSDKISFSKYQQIKDEIASLGGPIIKRAITEASNEQLSVPLHKSDSMTPKKAGFLSKIPFFGTSSQDILTPSLSNRPVVFISVALLLLGTAIVGRGIYDRFFSNTDTTLAYAPTPVVASRILSFQGRLTDSLGNPITASTNMRFRLYTASSGGTTLYDSGTCSIAPDQDGVHNVLIGSDCGSEVGSSVFTENGEVYLGVTVGADSEMTPRQRMANVPYAQNSETLQGLPLGKDVSSVPYINNAGDLLISAASPQIGSTYASQTFVVSSAQAVTLQSAGTGDVTLTATGSGELKFLVGGATAGVVNNSGNWGIKSSNPSTFELQVNGDVGPETDSAFDLGSNSVRWANVYADNIVGTITPGFTTGSVAFADGSGNLAQDNAQFFWDDTANKLGIGTSAPLGKFHLSGAATGKALAILNETGDQNILTASASGTTVANLDRSGNLSVEGALSDLSGATLEVNDNLDISGTLTSGTANAFSVDATGNISTSGSTGLTFSSTGGIVLTGGTITDGTDGVDINDDLEIAGGTTLGDASGDTVTANAASWTFANDTNYILSGGINGLSLDSTTFSVDATNDRIGIGTAAPDAAWLDIAAATTAKSQLNLTTSAGTNVSTPNSGDLWWNGTNLYFYNGSTNNDLLASGGSVAGSDTQVQYNNGGSFGGASALIYDDVNNRVGIGTATSPTSLFHVAGATIGKALAIFNETGDQNILTASASGTTVANLDRSGNLAIEGSLSDLSGAVLNIDDGLSIAGNTTFGDASGDTVTSNAATWTFANDTDMTLTGGVNGLSFDGTTFSVDSTNNRIGIGTAAPEHSLHIINDDAVTQTAYFRKNSASTTFTNVWSTFYLANEDTTNNNFARFNFGDGADQASSSIASRITDHTSNYGDLVFWTRGSGGFAERMVIEGNGNIGIGQAGPDAKLDVLSTTEQLRLTYTDGSAYSSFTTSSGGDLNIDATGNDITSSDRLTVGSATAGVGKLNVTGAETGKALSIFNETGDQAIITASASGTTRYTLANNGNITYSPSAFGTPITLYDVDTTLPNANTGIVDAINDAYTAAIGGGGGLWTDSGTTTYLTMTTDDVVIGGSAPLSSGKVSIDGDADQIQLIVQGNGTQTSSLAVFEQSDGTDVLTISNAGNVVLAGGTLSDTSDGVDIADDLEISGGTTLGDASGDTVTANAAAWTFANDTTVALSGGLNGLNFDSNTLSIDAAGDKIGIGTAAPDAKFQVTGAVTGKALAIFDETGDQDIIAASSSGSTRFRVSNDGTVYAGYLLDISNTAYGIDPAGTTNFGGYSMKITGGALLAADSGSVGIGDQTPDAKLNVLSTTEQLRLDYDDSNYTSFTVGSGGDLTIAPTGGDTNATGNLAISGGTTLGDASGDTVTANAAAWTFANDTTVALTGGVDGLNFDSNTLSIDATNNRIGLGTAAPTSPLTITAGTGGTAIPILSVTQQDNSGQPPVAQFIGTGGGTITMTWAGNISLQDTKTVHNSSYTQSYLSFSSGSTIVQSQNSTILFKDYNSGAYSEWARFSNVGSFGVNTTGPDAKIDSLSTTGEQLRLTYADGTAYTGFTVASSGDLTFDSSGGDFNLANADVLNIGGNADDVAFNAIGDDTANAANVASDNDLYVEDDLEVDGTIFGSLEGTVDLNFTDGSVLFANSSGAIAQDNASFFFDDSANELGIGDTTPDAKVDITATTEQLRLSYETGDTNYTSFTTSSGGDLTIAPTGADIAFTGTGDFSAGLKAGASDYVNIDSSGNIGIGTTATANYGIRFQQTIDTASASTSYADRRNVYFTGTTGGTYYYGNELNLNISSATAGNYYGTQSNFANNSATCAGCANTAYWTYSTNNVAANSVALRGYRADLANASTGISQDYRSFLSTISNGSTGSISTAVGYTGDITNSSSGTISTAYQHLVNSPTNASGTITNIYGMYIADQSVGTNTNAYGMYIASQAGASGNAIGLYIADSEDYSIQLASTDGDAASGITFGTDTNLYRNGANSLHTDDALDIDGAFTTDGDVAVNGDDITSDSNLTINATGYVRVGDTASPGSANGDDDLFVEGDLEIDGVMYLDGTLDTSFTAGSVVFAGTSGVLAQDNSSFFFDDSSNELGIGDTTPDAFLDVTGTTAQLRLSYETGDTNYTTFTTSSGGDLTIAPSGSDTNITGNLAVSGNTGLGDADADTTTITGKEILNFDATSLGNGDHNALYINAGRSSSTASTLRGLNLSANYSATSGTQTGVNGLDFTVQASGNGGTVTTMKGISAWGVVGTGATVTTFKLADIANPSNSGTITSLSGYSVDNLTSGTNNTLILAGTTTIPSGNWGIYNSSAYSNYLSGTTGIGTTGPDAKLDVLSTTEQLRLTYSDGSAYSAFTVSSGGDLTLDPTGGNIVVDANFNPNTHDTYDLGTDGSRWRDLYLGPDTLHVGTSTTDEGTLKYVTSTNVLTLTNNFGDTDFGSTSDGFNFTLGGGAGDDFIVDATTLVVESDNDRVGIGTATPDAAWLDIAAATTGKAQINLTSSSATDVSAPASGDLWWNGTNLYFYNGAINKDLLAAGGAGPWTDGGSYVYTTAGEVLNLGGVTGTAYHAISDSGTTSHGLAADDDLYVEGDFEVDTAFFTDGSTTIGDASGDTVTANAAAWTFANDTTVALTGGVDGINFDSNTLSIDGTNDRVGFGTAAPSAKTHVFATTEQMRLGYDVSNYASFTTSSGGDLTLDVTGGQLLLADADTINIGGVSALAYNAIADSGGATSHGLASDDDLFVEGDTEVNGTLFADGETVLTTVSGAGLSDCDSATSILLWDSTSKQFSCGKDNNTIVLASWTEVNVVASLTDAQMDRPQPAYLGGATSEIYVPYAGNIVGISIAGSAVRTAGSATFTVFKNDGTTGFTCVIDGTNTQYNDCTQASGTDTFAAGDFLDVRITTDLGFAPSAANEYVVEIWVEMDTGADVAELYNVKDASIRSADIVSIDPTLTDGVMKSTGSYDNSIMGVIATKPGVLLGQKDVPDIGMSRAVALTGRVPVKVTSENGPIKIGDAITSSSIPGVGMKSTRAARVVGRALSEWDNPDPNIVGTVMLFVEPAYDAGYILTQVQDLLKDAKNTVIADTFTAKKFITDSFKATTASIETLITQTFTAQKATITDAEIKNLNAQALKAEEIEAKKIAAETVKATSIETDTIESHSASISGSLVADTIDARNITEMRERLERLAATQDDSTVTSEQLDADLEQVQQYIDELTQSQSPENITDVETYQVSPPDMTLDAGSTETSLGQNVSAVNLESLIVTGTTSMTSLTVADAFSAGNIFIQDNSVVSMVNELKLTALESVDIMNGGVIIAKDGTLTAKGEVIAQKGVRTNSIKSLDGSSDVSVDLGQVDNSGTHSSFKVQADGNDVALIDSQGSADFKNLSLSTYSEATSSAVVIAAGDNYRQTGIYAPAIKTNAAASGNGILPSGQNDIIIFNDSIKKDTIVNLTPTSTTQNKSVYVDKVEACLDESNELCQPYFRVSIDDSISNDVTFNWLIVN